MLTMATYQTINELFDFENKNSSYYDVNSGTILDEYNINN